MITSDQLRGSKFYSREALCQFAGDAIAYEKAIKEYKVTGDDFLLREALDAIGFDAAEIEWHCTHRGSRMRNGWAVAADFPIDA